MTPGDCQCPKIDLADWRDREVSLLGQRFLSMPTSLFFHVPHRLYRDLESLCDRLDGLRYRQINAPMVLHRDGWFGGELLLSIDAQSPGSEMVQSFPQLFYSRVVEKPGFDAALRDMPKFYRDLRAASAGRIASMYFWYVNCPRCLIEGGVQQVILLARSTKVLESDPCPTAAAAAAGGRAILPCGVS